MTIIFQCQWSCCFRTGNDMPIQAWSTDVIETFKHDVLIIRYTDENGEHYEDKPNGISVTPLIPLFGSGETLYRNVIYNIRRIR